MSVGLRLLLSQRELNKVGHSEIAGGVRELRLPRRVYTLIGQTVLVEDTDEHLGDDASSNRPELIAFVKDLSLAQDVVPERRVAPELGIEISDGTSLIVLANE